MPIRCDQTSNSGLPRNFSLIYSVGGVTYYHRFCFFFFTCGSQYLSCLFLYLSFVCLFVLLDPYFNVKKSTLKLHKVRFLLHEFWLYSTLICSPPLSYCWYTIEISIVQIKFGWIVNILLQLEDAKEWETRCSWFYHVV